MADYLPWIQDNWFCIVQTIGIIAGLFFTASSLHQDAKAKEAGNVLALAELHRALWSQVYSRDDLKRVVSETVDLDVQPLTVAEEEFLNQAIILFQTGWQMARLGTVHKESAIEADARGFFSLPMVRAVWERSKKQRDEVFVRFVERALQRAPRPFAITNSASSCS